MLGALLAPAPAVAGEFKLWPLFRVASAPREGLLRWTALGPLVEYFRTPDGFTLHIRPLLTLERHNTQPSDVRADLLFPLARWRATDDDFSLRFLLFTYRTKHVPAAPGTSESALGIYPFAFLRRDARGTSGGVFPFYLDLHDVLGYDRVQTVLFPAYLRLDTPRVERRFYLFPLASTMGGPDGSGGTAFPFYGDTTERDQDHTRWILWPWHIRREHKLLDGGWAIDRVDLPFVASSERPGVHTRGYGLIGLTHTVDERAGTEAIGSPWPLVLRMRRLGEDAWFTWRAAPLYGRTDIDGFSSRFYAWPLYRWRRLTTANSLFERTDVLLLLWRWQHERLPSGRNQIVHTLFPLWRAAIDDQRHYGQAPALVDSILPTNRGVLDAWAPLYGLLRWDTGPQGTLDWNLLWGLVTRDQGVWHGPITWRPEAPDGH